MITDGERLKTLLVGSKRRVLLCAPFMKARVLETVLSVISDAIPVRIVTRWRAKEVAAGVSDLEVFEVANGRPNTELALLDDLHAKIYVADDDCLVGSANLTASALGWSERSNVELLVPACVRDEDVALLLRRLELAEAASFTRRSEVEMEAAAVVAAVGGVTTLDEGAGIAEWCSGRMVAWLPRCAAPNRLYEVYQNADTTVVAEGTKEDAVADLRDLNVQSRLARATFFEVVRNTLQVMPALRRILNEVPGGVTDARGIALVKGARPELAGADASEQWRIVRDWIRVFFEDEFEVAPESFVTRLRTR